MNGITINIDPVIAQLGGLSLRWYSLTLGAGIAIAVWLTLRKALRAGLDAGKVLNVALWAVVAGLVGARLFHVLDELSFYVANPHMILRADQGGLAIWGGLITGGLVAVLAAQRQGLPLLRLSDITPVGLLVGQILGRLGCIINGDAYGSATSMPWGFIYTNPGSMLPYQLKGVPTQPYPAYEILWDVVLLGILLLLRRRPLPPGALFMAYLGGYAVGRFGLTFVRQEEVLLWGLQQAQVIALVVLVFAVVGFVYLITVTSSSKTEKGPAVKEGQRR